MNWTNLKTYLIILLAGINIFLAASYINSMNKSAYFDSSTVTNTVEFLDKQGINVDKDTVPTRIYNSNIIECVYDEDYYESVASAISASEKESINILPDNSIRITTVSGSLFTFDSAFGFSYNGSASVADDGLLTLEYTPSDDKQQALSKQQHKVLSSFLYPEYQNNKTFSYSIKSVAQKSNGNIYALVLQEIDGIQVHEHTVSVEFDTDGIVSALGKWFFPTGSESYSYRLYDQLSVLVKEAQLHKADESVAEAYTVTAINHVYTTYWSASKDYVYFIPSWSVSTDKQDQRVYNAISCELYN